MLNIAKGIHSLSDFKRNDPEVTEELERTGGPVVLTVNGKAKYVVQDAESYQRLIESLEDIKTMRAILEMKSGQGRPAEDFIAELEKELKTKPKKRR
ncbi:MAG TPA: type II toxin-antitoxin system Phd/YefM family antitoxin [Blastocatellia bacterium]|nr:type II toxin-antitoxin system Phd/YefM family antitoxin [Blastocatellia bacterium]